MNPGSGKGGPSVDELTAAAEALEVEVHVLAENQDLGELARGTEADVLGMAGGDGSLGTVAAAAIERDVPFVCVPWGTRNHFASDIGLDSSEPLAALTAFREGHERRVDVGRVGERVFLNNVSLGIYARLVHRRERRRRRREIFARLRAIVISLRERRFTERFVVDGVPVRASAVLVANNEYRVDLLSLGKRDRIDEGVLATYCSRGLRRLRWTERTGKEVRIETRRDRVRAAIDGEPTLLDAPVELRVEAGVLRLLVPPHGSEELASGTREDES